MYSIGYLEAQRGSVTSTEYWTQEKLEAPQEHRFLRLVELNLEYEAENSVKRCFGKLMLDMLEQVSITHMGSPLCDNPEESSELRVYLTHSTRTPPKAIGIRRKLSFRSNQCSLGQLKEDI